jgi:hypothetical protein
MMSNNSSATAPTAIEISVPADNVCSNSGKYKLLDVMEWLLTAAFLKIPVELKKISEPRPYDKEQHHSTRSRVILLKRSARASPLRDHPPTRAKNSKAKLSD